MSKRNQADGERLAIVNPGDASHAVQNSKQTKERHYMPIDERRESGFAAMNSIKKLPWFYPWEFFANQCLAEASKPAEAGDLIAHT